jgi:hypothetical protein
VRLSRLAKLFRKGFRVREVCRSHRSQIATIVFGLELVTNLRLQIATNSLELLQMSRERLVFISAAASSRRTRASSSPTSSPASAATSSSISRSRNS